MNKKQEINSLKYSLKEFNKRAGLKRTIVNILRLIKRIPFTLKFKKLLKKNRKIVVHLAVINYDNIMKQRPQQIALSLSKQKDVLYFYVFHDNFGYMKKINSNLYLISDYYLIKDLLPKHFIHIYANLDHFDEFDVKEAILNGNKILYEYIDALHEDLLEVRDLELDRHRFIAESEDIPVFCTAKTLYDDIISLRKTEKNVYLTSNGVNYEDFQIKGDVILPDKLKKIYKKDKKYILYYGAIAKWLDYELLNKIAKKYKNYEIILIGKNYDKNDVDKVLKENKNINYLGSVNYQELKYYGHYADVFIIPFIINDVTKATSPVKVFEYMAMKKPVVITDLPECHNLKSIYISKSHEEFLNNIEIAIKNKDDEKMKKLLTKEALNNTWDEKSKVIYENINLD